MDRHMISRLVRIAGIAAFVFALTILPAFTGNVGAQSILSTPAVVGYVDHAYGAGVKPEPTADGAESKLWFNDGIWWGILFNAQSAKYEIYSLNWATQDWVSTGFAVDSRNEMISVDHDNDPGTPDQIVPSGTVDTRADVLWDADTGKLYIASHIKMENPSRVNNSDNWAKLFRYSYNSGSKSYSLDSGFPVDVNRDKTETLVLDKDSTGRLWVTYVSRVPDGDPNVPDPYKVMVNYTTAANNDLVWATPLDLSVASAGAVVHRYDVSALIAYSNKVGILWSNTDHNTFYFAEHSAANDPGTGWNVQPVSVPGVPLRGNDHIKLAANSAGQVFAAIKTDNVNPGEPLVGVLARETNGTFSFATFSDVGSLDTRPTMVLNESDNKLYVFAASNEAGGVICVKSVAITTPLSNMAFGAGSCSDTALGSADHFISDLQYNRLDNPTTSKHNVNSSMGIVAVASDDINGGRYLHNVIGNVTPPPPIAPTVTAMSPAQDATITGSTFTVTATFSQAMNPATINNSTFLVTGPGGAIAGTVSYDAGSNTATFTPTGPLTQNMTVQVQLTTGMQNANGTALAAAKSWSFNFVVGTTPPPEFNYRLFMPKVVR